MTKPLSSLSFSELYFYLPQEISYKHPFDNSPRHTYRLSLCAFDSNHGKEYQVLYFDKKGNTVDGWNELISKLSFEDAAFKIIEFIKNPANGVGFENDILASIKQD